MELLGNLGINGKLLLAQIINFLILLWVLKKFVYTPLLNVLEQRQIKIKKGLQDAEEAEKKLEIIKEEENKILKKARQEAQKIIEKAEQQAQKNSDEILKNTQKKADTIIKEAKSEIAEEKKKILQEAKSEIASLVFLATEKVVNEKMNMKKDRNLIEKIIKEK